MPLDSLDSVPDGVDEDCDGKVDEDVDVTRARCPRGARVIEGTRGDDELRGTWGRDCILGYGGNDTIHGEGGDDVIFAGPGDDRVFTGRGRNVVRAGRGDDVVDTRGSVMSTVFGQDGNDTMIGGSGHDTFFGGDGNDKLIGGGSADLLSGGGCHDLIVGKSSFDISSGGAGVDVCDTEIRTECERSSRTRKVCAQDSECGEAERCTVHTGFCVPRSAEACGAGPSCTPTASEDETCDGVDDDCDGSTDEDYLVEPTVCGEGSCQATGETSCVNGTIVDSCSASSPMGTDMVCNGVDDDCDGAVDEGYVPTPTTCGVGACGATGMLSCIAGAEVDSCQPEMPEAATDTTCNGVDEDCDGVVDEDYAPAPTSCGLGACVSTGVTSCVDGAVVDSCMPGDPLSETDLTCDQIDDDCDGSNDDDFVGTPTTCGYGECETTGTTACSEGAIIDTCVVTCEGNCADGAEDDGDGLLDCADTDCQDKPELWPQCADGYIGSPCGSSADCAAGLTCETNFPGGYCFVPCNPGCPSGSVCWAGTACVQPCVGATSDACPRPEHVCEPLGAFPMPFCRPDCNQTCPVGTTCRADTLQCM